MYGDFLPSWHVSTGLGPISPTSGSFIIPPTTNNQKLFKHNGPCMNKKYQKINGKHIPCVFSPGLCNANSYISPKKILTTKTHVSRVTSLRRIIGEGSRVGHGDGSRVPLKKLERDEPMCFFGGCYRSPRQSLDSRGPVFFSSELRYLPSKERANISSLKGKRNTSSNRLKSANWEGRWDIFLEGRSDCEESQYLFDA